MKHENRNENTSRKRTRHARHASASLGQTRLRSLGDDFYVNIVHMKIMMSWLQENTRDGTDIKAHQVTS